MIASKKILVRMGIAVCGLAFAAGCGKDSSSSDGSGSGAGSEAIEFHNTLIEFSKTARDPLRKIVQAKEKSVEWIEREGIPASKPMWNTVLSGINPYDKLAKDNLAAPKSFSKDDQEFFNSRIALTKDSGNELNQIITTLTAYYKADDYKDDKHQKFLDLQPRIEALVEAIAVATGEMGERSEEIASAAEREALKKNPIGIYILNMRDVMEKCETQMELLTDERLIRVGSGTERRTDEAKAESVAKVADLLEPADALAREIAEMAEKFKAVDKSALKNRDRLAKDYDEFFTALDDQQGTVRKNLRFAKEQGYVGTESDLRNLSTSLRKVVNAHNSFIENVNKGH